MITLRLLERKTMASGLGLIILVFLVACGSESEKNTAASSAETVNPQRLVGHWVRPDGGYILEITRVRSSGKLEARYLNPRPIHIESAELVQNERDLGVFIEFQDRGYPGSYYELKYDRDEDLLIGNYFQATQQAVYEVVFVRRQ